MLENSGGSSRKDGSVSQGFSVYLPFSLACLFSTFQACLQEGRAHRWVSSTQLMAPFLPLGNFEETSLILELCHFLKYQWTAGLVNIYLDTNSKSG